MTEPGRKISIDELEKILNKDGPPVTIQTDGTVRTMTEGEVAEAEADRQRYRDNLIERLQEENKLLKSALKTLTQKW